MSTMCVFVCVCVCVSVQSSITTLATTKFALLTVNGAGNVCTSEVSGRTILNARWLRTSVARTKTIPKVSGHVARKKNDINREFMSVVPKKPKITKVVQFNKKNIQNYALCLANSVACEGGAQISVHCESFPRTVALANVPLKLFLPRLNCGSKIPSSSGRSHRETYRDRHCSTVHARDRSVSRPRTQD